MASWKTPVPTLVVGDISELIDVLRNEILPNATDPTFFIIPSVSGTMDPLTEEIVFHLDPTIINASGIVGTVMEEDLVFGMDGQIQVGDVKVTYLYEQVSGVLAFPSVDQVTLLSPGVSGLYNIIGRMIDVVGNTPIFVDFALKPVKNG